MTDFDRMCAQLSNLSGELAVARKRISELEEELLKSNMKATEARKDCWKLKRECDRRITGLQIDLGEARMETIRLRDSIETMGGER